MRSFTVTAFIATGLIGAAAPAWAAAAPAGHGRPAPVHPAFAHPQPDPRQGIQPGTDTHGPAQPGSETHQRVQPGTDTHGPAQPGAEPHQRVQPATDPRRHIEPAPDAHAHIQPATETHQRSRPEANAHARIEPEGAPHRRLEPEPRPQGEPARNLPARAAYVLNMTGQAAHWDVLPGQTELVRWTLINAGERRLEHVQLVASVPEGWTVREGEGCARQGTYLGCEIGSLEPGRSAAVVVPMVAQRPYGPVRLTAWSRAAAGRMTIPGPTTSFRVFVAKQR